MLRLVAPELCPGSGTDVCPAAPTKGSLAPAASALALSSRICRWAKCSGQRTCTSLLSSSGQPAPRLRVYSETDGALLAPPSLQLSVVAGHVILTGFPNISFPPEVSSVSTLCVQCCCVQSPDLLSTHPAGCRCKTEKGGDRLRQ